MRNPIALASLFILLLFCGASFYCYPQYDDFSYAYKVLHQGFWATQLSEYCGWNGRYLATALLTAGPMVWGTLAWYRAIPIALIVGLVLSLFLVFRVLRTRLSLPAGQLQPLPWALIFSAMFALSVPDVAQAFYWSAASLTYTLPLIFCNLAIALYFSRWPQWAAPSTLAPLTTWVRFAVLAFLLVGTIGCDETIMFIVNYVLVTALAFRYWRERKVDRFLLALLVVAISSSLVVVLAPGNSVRGAYFENGHKIVRTAGNLIQFTLLYPFQFITIPLAAVVIRYFSSDAREGNVGVSDLGAGEVGATNSVAPAWLNQLRAHRWYVLAFWLGITFVACFPSSWAMGGQPNSRTRNLIVYFFVLGLLPVTLAFFRRIQIKSWRARLSTLAVAVAFFIGLNMFNLAKDYALKFNNYSANWQKMLAGQHDQLLEKDKPKTLFVDDLGNVAPETLNYFKAQRPEFFR